MDAEQLRAWLMIQPRPSKVVFVDANGDRHELEVSKTMTWKSVAESGMALDPEKMEAYTADKLSRAAKKADFVDENEAPGEEDVLVNDPESQRMVIFARLIADAYRHSNETAFRTLSDICTSMQQRSQSLENALRSTEEIMMKTFEDAVVARAKAEASNGDETSIVETLIRSMAQGAVKAGKNANGTNGAGEPTT